jgi:hypothetical protein
MVKRFWDAAETELDLYHVLSDMLNRNTRWVEVADAKAAAVLVFVGAVVRTIADPVSSSVRAISADDLLHPEGFIVVIHSLFLLTTLTACLAALWAVYHAFMTLIPRVSRQPIRGRMFFADIASRDINTWRTAMLSATPADLVDDLLAQVHAASVIASAKHGHTRMAIGGLFGVLALAPVLYLLSQFT